MTKISYNNVIIDNVMTESIDQEVVRDKTGVDPIFVRTRVSVTGIVRASQTSGIGLALGDDLGPGLRALMNRLMIPRRHFIFWIGDQELFNVYPSAAENTAQQYHVTSHNWRNMDVEHGPTPQLQIAQIIGTHSVRVRFNITFASIMADNPSPSGLGGVLLNFRFWIGEDIDGQSWLTTRTYHGRLRVAHREINVHEMVRKAIVIPPLQGGFWRKNISLQESDDGLEIEFTIQDEEIWAAAPWPAIQWEATHQVASPMAGGAIAESQLNVTLYGDKHTPKKNLLSLATKIIDSKLHLFDRYADGRVYLLNAAYEDRLDKGTVSANARIRHVGASQDYKLWNVVGKDLGTPLKLPGYNSQRARPLKQTATTAGLFLSALQDSLHPASMPQGVRLASQAYQTQQGKTEVSQQQGSLDPAGNYYSPAHLRNAYSQYSLSSEIHGITGDIYLPTGGREAKDLMYATRLHRPHVSRKITIEAERLQDWPVVPSPISFSDKNGIYNLLIDYTFVPHAPALSGDGLKTLYRLDAELLYHLNREPSFTKEGLLAGQLPYRVKDKHSGRLPPEFFIEPGEPGSPIF